MMKLKEVCSFLDKKHIEYERCGQYICINSCALGDNFYDYGESPKEIEIDDEEVEAFLLNDNRIHIVECCDCCGCAGW